MIADSLIEFANAYPDLKTAAFSHNNVTRIITETIPDNIAAALNLSNEEYLVRGSVGQGQWAEILHEEKKVITLDKAIKILAKKYNVNPEQIEIK